jgi:heme-degrading monooxygenase HmoA
MLGQCRFAILVLYIFGSLIFMAAPASAADKVLRHVVMYKFNEDVTPAQIQEVIDAFAALPKKVDTIVGFEHGTNVSKEGKSEGFTHVFVVTFKSEADLAAYLVHPAHEAYVKVVRDRREKVVVFDYWTGR